MRFFQSSIVWLLVLLPLPVSGTFDLLPAEPGPYPLTTIEAADIRDRSRGNRPVPIKIHLPATDGRWPVVVVSHGGGGHWDANLAQARHLASHGYAVFCLEHSGSNTQRLKQGMRILHNLRAMTRDADEVLNRPRDVSFALDLAEAWNETHPRLKGRLDLAHIDVMGHSYGAYTTLVVCGARVALDWLEPEVPPGSGLGPDLSDPRVDACVALSPQGPGEPFFLETSYGGLTRPVMGISGSRDRQQGAPPENRRRFFELVPPGDKIFLWLSNADHMAFSDSSGSGRRSFPSRSRRDAQPLVRAATLLFFETYLRENPEAGKALSVEALMPLLGGNIDDLELLKK